MTDSSKFEKRPLDMSDLIEEGGWQKPVSPPQADARPVGMPPKRPAQAHGENAGGSGSGGGDQGQADA